MILWHLAVLAADALAAILAMGLGADDFETRLRWTLAVGRCPLAAAVAGPLLREHPDAEVAHRAEQLDPDVARCYWQWRAEQFWLSPHEPTDAEIGRWVAGRRAVELDLAARRFKLLRADEKPTHVRSVWQPDAAVTVIYDPWYTDPTTAGREVRRLRSMLHMEKP